MQATTGRDPGLRRDAGLAVVLAAVSALLAAFVGDARTPNALGWTLLLASTVPLVWRRRRPVLVLLLVVALVAPYHALDFHHSAPVPATMVALYTVAVTGTVRRTVLVGALVLAGTLTSNALTNPGGLTETVRIFGWAVAVLILGGYVRVHRQYIASIVERAERAERTREEEARRRVAEERLRIARDLHDLLAHSITLIGVQTSVAAHVLAADPERLDRAAVAGALDDIAETCRSARGELRTTLEVLRDHNTPDVRGPLPDLRGLADLVDTARAGGADVDLSVRADGVPPAVGAAAYRIVQEALTNAVRHGGRDDLTVRVRVHQEQDGLHVSVTDDGAGQGSATPGFGLIGMRERVRSVGGVLDAGPRAAEGFEVTAVLPLHGEREGER
ncbi:MAG: ATP-binding protein [Streptomyces sp.]|nr:ATP-binding protein [Streptomyces sp.]